MKKNIFLLIILLIITSAGLFLFTRMPAPITRHEGRLSVTTSFYPLYFFAHKIAGDKAEVKNIVPAGVEPHEFEPASRDIAAIEDSGLFIVNGGEVDQWSAGAIETLAAKHTLVVIAAQQLMTRNLDEDGKKITDPHVWLSPQLAKKEVAAILAGFVQADSKHAAYYEKNAKDVLANLDVLDTMFKTGLATCDRREFVTSHEAFGYLADAYGLTQVAISGVSPEEEPTVQGLAAITKLVEEKRIPYIFFETLVSPKLAETIARETGAKTLVLDPLEGVSKAEQKKGVTYITVMEQNLNNLRLALGCK